jgi:hypothetical protein
LFLWMLNGVAGLVHNGGCDFITCDWRCKSGRYICSLRYSSQYGGALPSMSSTIGSSFVVGLTVDTCYRLVDNSISPVMTVWKNIYFTCNDSSAHHSDHKVGCVVYDISSNTHLLVVGDISACAPSSRSRTTFDAVKCNFVGATTLSPRHDELDLQASPWSLLSTMKTAVEDPASAHNASIAVMSVICVCGVGDCRAAHPLSYYFDLSAASSACWSLISCRHTYMDSLLDSTSSRRLPADVVSMCCTLEPELVLISPSDYRSQPSSVFLGFTGWSVMCYSGFASSSWYYSESSPGLLVTWCYMPSTLLHFLHFQRCCMKSRHLHILLSTMVSVGYFTQVSRCRILVASRNNIYASSVLVLLCRWLRLRRIAVVSSWWSLFPVSSAVLLIYDLTCRLSFSSTFGADSSFPRHFVAGPSRAYYSSTDWIMVSPSAPSAFSSLDWISLCGISPSSPVKLVGYGITLLCVVAVCLQNVYAHCALVFDAWMNFELAIETFRYSRWNGSVAVDASASSPWNQAWPNFSAACTWYYVTQIVWLISTSHLSMGDLLGTRFNHYHAPRCQVSVSCFGTVFTSWYGALILFIVSCQWSVLHLPTVVSYGWPMLLAFSAFVDSTYCPGMAYTHSTYWTVMAILVSHRASWFVRHGFQYLLIECCGHFDFAETMLVLILRGFVVCSSLFLVTTHCTMILSGLLEGTIDPMETGPAASRISPAEYIWVDDLMLDLLGSLSALQIVISSTGVLGLTTIGTHLLDGSSFAEVLMSKDYLRALQLNVAKSYGRWYSRVGNAEGGVLVMISSLFQEHRQSLRLVLATTVYFLGCFHHVNGTVGFISIVEYLPLLFSQYGCFELRIDSILADLHSWCLLWTDLIVAVAYWKYLVRTERNVSIVDLVQLIWPSNMSMVPLGDSSLVYWSLPKRRTFVSTRDLIDRSLTRCSGLIDDGISIENLFDPSLPRCNEWINMFGWICGLSPLPICNAWMTKFLDLLLPKYSIMIQRIVSLLSSWTSWLSTVPSMAWLYHLMHEAVAVKWYSGLLADATFFQFFAFLRSVLPIIPLVPIHVLFGP